MQAGQRDNQMGTETWEVVCDENGIGGDGEYCGDNDAQFGRINVGYFEAPCGKYVPRAALFDREPGVIDVTSRNRRLACSSAQNATNFQRVCLLSRHSPGRKWVPISCVVHMYWAVERVIPALS
jgi:hypothetical protein